jgi:hypothetical protein
MSSPMQFDRPAPPGDQFSPETHVGALLVIDVLEHVPPMQTKVSDKPQDAIRANVYVISPQGTVAEQFLNTLLFPRMLVSRLQQSVGRKVLGILTGQPGVKRDGKNIPYDLDDPNDAMMAAAGRAMAAHLASQMQAAPPAQQWGQQPATQQAPNGWGQPPAQQGPPPGWGQQPAAGVPNPGPAGGWGQQPPQGPPPQQPTNPGPWGQAPAEQYGQQQLPAGGPPATPGTPWQQEMPQQEERPPWATEQPPAAPWGGQQ